MYKDIYNKIPGIFQKNKLVVKYFIVGVLTSLIDLFLLFILTEYYGLWYLTSAALALAISFSAAFVFQKYWTFGDYSNHNIDGQFFSYLFIILLSFGLTLGILSLFVEFAGINYILAQLISLCITGVISFVMSVRNVFSHPCNPKGVVIASGIFPPDIGGPAFHIQRLVREFTSLGVKVSVVTYARASKGHLNENFDITRIPSSLPILLRGLAYMASLFVSSVSYHNIFAQDLTATGLPAMIIKKILPHKRLVIRIGGDLLWERKTESGETTVSNLEYYNNDSYKSEFIYKVCKAVMDSADQLIVTADFVKDIYVRFYGISPDKILVLKNTFPKVIPSALDIPYTEEKTILFAGRFIKFKNVSRLIRAFISIYEEIKPAKLVLVGEGPEKDKYIEIIDASSIKDKIQIISTLPQKELFLQIQKSSLCVCPSWTEPNSNFILECMSYGRPVLLTRNNGLSITLPEEMLFSYDNEKELCDKIKSLLAGGVNTQGFAELIRVESANSSWENVLTQYKKIFDFK